MDFDTSVTFAAAVFIFAAAPGPGVIAVASQSLRQNLASSLFMSLGIVTGDMIYLCFSLFGLALLAGQIGDLFIFIRLLGAAYLVYLGVRLLIKPADIGRETSRSGQAHAYRSGILISLGNPKVIFFYLGFLPAFCDLNTLGMRGRLIILTLSPISSFAALSIYALAGDRLRPLFTNATRRICDRVMGCFLIMAGAKAATTP